MKGPYDFNVPSHTSSGGYVRFSVGRGNGEEITIEVFSEGYEKGTKRTDARVNPDDLFRVVRVLKALR